LFQIFNIGIWIVEEKLRNRILIFIFVKVNELAELAVMLFEDTTEASFGHKETGVNWVLLFLDEVH
jgi:hypothetical protein